MSNKLDHMLDRARKGTMSRREFMGRTTAMGVSAGIASALFAKVAVAQEPVKGGTMRIGLSGGESTNSLDPALAASPAPNITAQTWGEKLVDVTAEGEIDLRIADDMSSSADASEWTFRIRQGLTFHDGSPVTAEDVVATYRRHTDEESQSGALGIVQGIADMKAEGDKVVLTLASPNADLPFLLADYHLTIQPGGGYDAPDAGIGAGPYKVEEFDPGVLVRFSRNENYFDSSIGHADEIEFLIINDNTARTAALQSGQVHMINRVDPQVVPLLADAPGIQVKQTSGRGHYTFIMHCDTPPFDSNDLRMALKLAVKREEMVEKILGGLGSMGNDFPINATYPLFDETIPQREYDPEAAAEYYAKSGHDGSPIILRTAAVAFAGAVDAANLFAASANAAGIPLQVQLEPDDGYWEEVWNIEPFSASYWSGRPVQDQMYTTAYVSTAEWNDTRFFNEEFDQLLFKARAELDQAARKDQYSQMAYLVRDEGGVIIPMFNDFVDGIRDEVQGWYEDRNSELMNYRAPVRCWLG